METGTTKGKCYFCENEAHGSCCWPTEDFQVIKVTELKVGDLVKRWKCAHQEVHESTSRAYVHTLIKTPDKVLVALHIQPRQGISRFKNFTADLNAQVRALRKGVCGVPVCENHLAARGPGIYVCRDHWSAWEQTA